MRVRTNPVRRAVILLVGGPLLSLALVACGSDGARKQDVNARIAKFCVDGQTAAGESFASGIIGGKVVGPNSWLAGKVFLLTQDLGNEDSSICTATLVAPDVALTAAHCVDAVGPDKTYALFATQPLCEAARKGRLAKGRVATIRIHPNYSKDRVKAFRPGSTVIDRDGLGDLALVKLTMPAPAPYQPIELVQSPVQWTGAGPYVVAGFGWDSSQGRTDDNPVLRTTWLAPLRTIEMDAMKRLLHTATERQNFDRVFDRSSGAEFIYLNQSDGRGLCHGDSGGPAFLRLGGRVVQVGVTSQVFALDQKKECEWLALSTNVYFHHAWLEQTFAELRGGMSSQPLFRRASVSSSH